MKSEKNEIRLLEVNEIECRIGTINENGLSLLLYKDARVDQKILDECYSPCGWKRSHQEIGGNLYCTVEVWDKEKQQWIAKQDVDTESYTEKEKGQASDSMNVRHAAPPTLIFIFRPRSSGSLASSASGTGYLTRRSASCCPAPDSSILQ